MALVCDICKIRPADARITFMQGGRSRTVDICRQDYLQLQANGSYNLPSMDQPNPEPSMDITDFFSKSAQETMQRAAETAAQFGTSSIENEHLLFSLADSQVVQRILAQFQVKTEDVKGYIDANAWKGANGTSVALAPSEGLKHSVGSAFQISRDLGHTYIGPEHLLIALLEDDGLAGSLLKKYGLTAESLRQQTVKLVGEGAPDGVLKSETATPQLDKYSRDLTALAKQGQLDPVIGRKEEIETTIEVLSRRTKNNPVLVGEPGVGKTAIVEGLAQRIIEDKVPDSLHNKRVLELSLNSLLSGTKYRGEFEERIKSLLEEIVEHKDEVLVFVDELHTVVGAGSAEGGLDAANVLKPALARGELHLIGATTLKEYRKHIEKDAALERRFQPVSVGEPTAEQAVQIMHGLRGRYEEHHKVKITDEALITAVKLSDRYIGERHLPDKAIDLVDQAAARVHIAGMPEVTPEQIAQVVSKLTGVPVTELTLKEKEKLLHLEERLHKRVIGQEQAVKAVANAIRISRSGLGKRNAPIATFLFLGPTGVGKTELAKALAETIFGSEQALIRLDMSEYMERHAVARMIGSPPGYVGHDEGGQLTEAVRRRPYSVILLDEIEKAHPDAYNVLLQLLDDGRLTDGKGRVVDFSNTIIIATSNLGTERHNRQAKIGFAASTDEQEEKQRNRLMEILHSHFRPEFINRLDEVIVFQKLNAKEIRAIVSLQLNELTVSLKEQALKVTFSESLRKHLAEVGFNPAFGARELRRKIKQEVENALAAAILAHEYAKGTMLVVGYTQKGGVTVSKR